MRPPVESRMRPPVGSRVSPGRVLGAPGTTNVTRVRDSAVDGCEDGRPFPTLLFPTLLRPTLLRCPLIVLPPTSLTEDAVLVRVAVRGRRWPRQLPPTPDATILTVSLGAPRLMPATEEGLADRGYRVVGITDDGRPLNRSIDILVPAEVRALHPGWWQEMAAAAERIFDLRHGPVQQILAPQLAIHARALAS